MSNGNGNNWGVPNRPKVSLGVSFPDQKDGVDGDIQIKQTNLGAKLFGKIGGSWFGAPLTATEGNPVTRIGVNMSDHLSIDSDSVDIYKNSVKVAEFGENITIRGALVISNGEGADNIVIGDNISSSMENGGGNLCIGNYSGNSLGGGGFYNTLIGTGYAGHAITSGDRNICIGRYAGHADSPSGEITTASNQICLGADTITDLFCKDNSISTSDERDKADIEDFNVGLDFVKKMRPVTYRWDMRSYYDGADSDGSKKESEIQVGFIAQEVQVLEQEVGYSELKDDGEIDQDTELIVNTTNDCSKLGLQYSKLSTIIVNAVQELSAKIDTMQTEINNLKQG